MEVLIVTFPLWGIFLATLLGAVICIEFGFRTGSLKRERSAGDETIKAGPFATATLSLLAFTLAFMFGAAESRLGELKHAMLDEVNAIGTVYLRADLLPAADGVVIRELLRDYLVLRIEPLQTNSRQEIERATQRVGELQSDLWSRAAEIALQAPTPVSALFVDSVNELIDLSAERRTIALRYRLPGIMWIVLCGLAILGMAVGGHESGLSDSRRFVGITLAAAMAFSVVFTMVVALDRPERYLSRATRAAMVDLHEDLLRSMDRRP